MPTSLEEMLLRNTSFQILEDLLIQQCTLYISGASHFQDVYGNPFEYNRLVC